MTGNWEAELRKLKQQFNEETMKTQKNATSGSESSEFRKLKKQVESLLLPVVEVFNAEGLTKTLQPHIHKHENGYTLVVPIAELGVRPSVPRLELELLLTENGYALKVIHDTTENSPATEKIIQLITEERIREEIRTFLIQRQNIILDIKKRAK